MCFKNPKENRKQVISGTDILNFKNSSFIIIKLFNLGYL